MCFHNTLNLFKDTNGACMQLDDPCPQSNCRHHIHNSAKESQIARSALTRTTCSLKLAEKGSLNLEEIGGLLGITRERVRQVELGGLTKLKKNLVKLGIDDDSMDDFLPELTSRES